MNSFANTKPKAILKTVVKSLAMEMLLIVFTDELFSEICREMKQ
jgi:hypothetical protein